MTMLKALIILLCVAVAFGLQYGYYGDNDRFDVDDDSYRLRIRLGGSGYSGARYIRPNVYPKYVRRVVSRPSIIIRGVSKISSARKDNRHSFRIDTKQTCRQNKEHPRKS
ncbi:Hypothetical predicted protein [Mytilus galloprovincialis]|uniref:Uncharacterized protein n=1 Tax=Mytilus galloprovincialis TaxID=29158 RepID=A0A8B6FLB5_MYTGA|nr:Hypothetical predicted protein [Mytilus galloprovincialis]